MSWTEKLYRSGWALLLFFAPLGGAVPGVLLFLAAAAVAVFKREKAITNSPQVAGLNILLGSVLLWGLLGGLASPNRATAVPLIVLYGLLVWGVFSAVQFAAQRLGSSLRSGIWLLTAGSVASALYTLFTYFFLHYGRARSVWAGCNAVGPLFTLAVGIVIGYWQSHKNDMPRYLVQWGMAAFLLMVAALITTNSRGGVLGFGTMLILISIRSEKLRRWLIGGALVIVLTLTAVFPSVANRLPTTFDIDKNQDRVYIWGAAIRIMEEHPLIGIGVGAFPFEYKNYKDPADTRDSVAYAHNLFLAIGSELGLPALAVFLIWLVLFAWHFYVKAKENPLLWGAFSAWLGVLVHQMVDNEIWVAGIAAPFWAVVALGLYWDAQMPVKIETKGEKLRGRGEADYITYPPVS